MCDDALTEGAGCDACQKAGSRLNAKLNGVSGHQGLFCSKIADYGSSTPFSRYAES